MVQSITAVGAMILISIGILAMNRGFDTNNLVLQNSRVAIVATSLATSKIEEAKGKAFDAGTVDTLILSTTGLTAAAHLGIEGSETYPRYDDFDDFNNTVIYDTINLGGTNNRVPFTTRCTVCYIDPNYPGTAQAGPTWHKKIIVRVTSPVMNDTITQEAIFSYFHFQ